MNFMSRIIINSIKLILTKDVCLYQLKSETKKKNDKNKKIFCRKYILKPITKKK